MSFDSYNKLRLLGGMLIAMAVALAFPPAASADEMVTDGAYANSANWTWSVSAHDPAATHTVDGSGSAKTAAVGRNATATGTISQTLGSAIPAGSTVDGVVAWAMHQNAAVAATTPGTVTIDLQYADLTWVTVFTTSLTDSQPWTSMANGTALPLVLAQNVGSVRITVYTKAGNNASAASTAWLDDVSISYTPAINTTAPGTVTLAVISDTQIDVTMPYTDNANGDGSCSVEYNTVNSWPGTAASCSPVSGASPRACSINGLNPGTLYYVRVIYSDPDGISGGQAATQVPSATTTGGTCVSQITSCADCHAMPPADWDGVSPKDGTTGHRGDHAVPAHTSDGARDKCAICHFKYSGMVNVTSAARWPVGHLNGVLDIFTSNHVANKVFSAPYDKGIKGGYYKGYRNKSTIFKDTTPNSNNVCTATYCHGAGDSPVWGTGTSACGSCHGVSTPPAGGKHTSHTNGYVGYKDSSNATTYNFGCYKCHDEGAVTHASGPVSGVEAAGVGFDNRTAPFNPSGNYTPGGTTAGTDGTFNWTDGTCASLYCHSDGKGGYTNPTWNGTLAANCLGCHKNNKASGGGNIMATGKHTEHVNNADADLATFGCVKCHNATVSADRTLSDKSNHVNGTPDVAFDTLNPSGSYSSPDCSTVYCHSSGQATPAFRTTAAWNSATVYGCDDCHGSEGTSYVAGAPEYANVSTSNRNSFNGHYVSGHVSAAGDCIDCHRTVVNSFGNLTTGTVKHINSTIDVVFKGGGTYANKRCSGTASSCHGSTTPRWGGSLICADCHQVTTAELDNFSYGDANKATVNFYEYTSVGHGKKGTYRYTGQAGANLSCTSTNDTNTVGGCHRGVTAHNVTGNPFRLVSSATIRPTDPNSLCATTCHTSPGVQNHVKSITGGTKYATWFFTPKCVDCHDPHGDNGGNDTTQRNYMMVQSFVNYSTGSNAYGAPYPAATYPRRAMDFPAETTRPASLSRASFVTATYDGICQICHRRNSSVVFDRNQNQSHNGTTLCTDCHTSSLAHNEGFKGAGGSCLDCHNQVQNSRPSMQAEFGKTSHHVNASWASFTTTTCSVCHLEGDSTGGTTTYHNNDVGGAYPVDLRVIVTVGATEATTVTNNTNSVQFYTGHGTNGGTRSAGNAANRHCGGCHNDTNAASKPFPAAEATDLTPGAYTPTNAGSVFKRYSSATTTKSHPYNPNTYNVVGQLNKAYSPHGHPEKNQMKNVVSGAWADDTQTVSNAVGCLDCHNSHGSNAGSDETGMNMITYNSSVGGYFGGLIKEDSTYDPDKSGTTFNAVSDLCFDCHLGDDANAPKKYSDFGVAAARPVKEYFDAGRWTPNSDSVSSTFSYKTGALAANSGRIKGGHFGASEALRGSATNTVNGSCLACHDPHGTPYTNLVGPAYNRAYMAPSLKGTWMASPYKEDRVGGLNASTLMDANTYSYSINKAGREAPRESPAFPYNNPTNLGAGFGTGNATLFGTYGGGGTGHDGYFIDDNTFGNSGISSTASNPWASAISGSYMSETDTQFGGLCLGCHPQTSIDGEVARTAGETGNVAINVHRAVKGWDTIATASDFFKPAHTNQHLMAYKATGTDTTNWCGTTHAYYPVPSGYRWSVNPGTQISITAGRPPTPDQPMVDPPSGGGGQQGTTPQSTYHQFPCAKCHAPHSTKLPRLMKTNCLDVGPTESSGTHYPKHNTSFNMGYCDDGSGVATYKRSMVCHNANKTNTSGGGGWNIKTGW